MQFTYKNPARSTDPQATLPGARSILVGARSYHRRPPPPPEGQGPVARVARYVWADDHEALLGGLEAVAEVLRAGGWRACVVADQNHLVDRAVAHRAGLGWYGKNANLLLPGAGSWFVLGSVLTDAPVAERSGVGPVVPDGCGSCERCLPACPTGAIVAPGVVDARRCLSWTLQATGTFPVDQRVALGDRIYGCDECQDVCPPNRREQRRGHRAGPDEPPLGDPVKAWVPVLDLLAATDDELLAEHGSWYIARRDPRYLRRNALVVLGNVGDGGDPQVVAVLDHYLHHADALLRAHAVWSARRLGCHDLLVSVASDPDPAVRAELRRSVPASDPAPR
jgi:epoxyqueuosine reductase